MYECMYKMYVCMHVSIYLSFSLPIYLFRVAVQSKFLREKNFKKKINIESKYFIQEKLLNTKKQIIRKIDMNGSCV